MNIQTGAEKFCDHSRFIRGLTGDTVTRYRSIARNFRRSCGIERYEEITEQAVQRFFYEGRTERNWRTTTYATHRNSLLAFFRWSVQQGYMDRNYAEAIEMPKLEKRLPSRLSRHEAERLLETVYNYPNYSNYMRARNHAIFATFLHAGLRKSELVNLHFTDLDIDNQTIFVRRGKGQKDRIIPMSGTLAQSLRRYREMRTKAKKTCPEFFSSGTRDEGLGLKGLMYLLAIARKSTGYKFSFHSLRHTFATLMLEGGCDIYSLSRMMGHSDIKTTTIYLAATAEHLRAQIGKHPLN